MPTANAAASARPTLLARYADTMLSHRFITGFVLFAVFLSVLFIDEFWPPWYPFWLVFCTVFLLGAAQEFVGMLSATSAKPSANTVYGGVLAILIANWAPHVVDGLFSGPSESTVAHAQVLYSVHALAWPFCAFVGVVMVAFLVQSAQFSRPGRTMATLAGTVLAIAYVGLLGSFVLQLRWMEGQYHGLVQIAALMATAKGADIGAFAFGRLAGQHKLWPQLSPNKTIEGAVGGLALAVAASASVIGLAKLANVPTLSWLATLGYGLLVGTAAQLGDLMESMIKRDCEKKDASDTLPGFGGLLDVMDSVLFAGPIAFGYWLLFGPW